MRGLARPTLEPSSRLRRTLRALRGRALVVHLLLLAVEADAVIRRLPRVDVLHRVLRELVGRAAFDRPAEAAILVRDLLALRVVTVHVDVDLHDGLRAEV